MNKLAGVALVGFSATILGLAGVACTAEPEATPPKKVTPTADAGEDDAGTPEEDGGTPDSGFVVTPPPPGTFPRAVSQGGPVIKAPKVVAITFKSDPMVTQIESFTSKMATSTFWADTATEYGIGALTVKPPIRLNENAPTTTSFDGIATWLEGKFNTDPAFGTPDSSTLYAIYYPSGTTISDGALGTSCQNYGGFHYETTAKGQRVGYAVMPRCSMPGQPDLDTLTVTASHEYFEWATDPFPTTSPAWSGVDPDHYIWSRVFLGELGDLCTLPGLDYIRPTDLGFTVQRMWSNKSSTGGHHPCVPSKETYFTAIPALEENITSPDGAGTTKGVKVGVGQKKTIPVTIYADGPVSGSIDLQVLDIADAYYQQPAEFTYQLSKSRVAPGETVQLTITGASRAQAGFGFLIVSRVGSKVNLWPGMVVN
jgi:hypothetical protein